MTLESDRFHEQLMGYLYGELEGESLREFEESLRASEQHRSELASMQETLGLSRRSLDALRERDQAPPARVSRAVLAAAAAEAAGEHAEAHEARAAPARAQSPRRADLPDRERQAPSFWSFLRTPWLLPTLGVAAAVSVVVLHKQVESPKMSEYQTPTSQQGAPVMPEPVPDLSKSGEAAPSLGDAVEEKRAEPLARPRDRADQARAVPRKTATTQSQPGKGFAVPPPAWSGLPREESAKKEPGKARRASSPGAAAEIADEHEVPPARDMGSDGFAVQSEGRGGGGAVAAKPAARARSTAGQAAPLPAPSVPAASAPLDDVEPFGAPTSSAAGARAESSQAPDEVVKKALEHMKARRFGQAAVAYRELLQRYPRDSRVPFFRSQLTAALAALSNVDAIR